MWASWWGGLGLGRSAMLGGSVGRFCNLCLCDGWRRKCACGTWYVPLRQAFTALSHQPNWRATHDGDSTPLCSFSWFRWPQVGHAGLRKAAQLAFSTVFGLTLHLPAHFVTGQGGFQFEAQWAVDLSHTRINREWRDLHPVWGCRRRAGACGWWWGCSSEVGGTLSSRGAGVFALFWCTCCFPSLAPF